MQQQLPHPFPPDPLDRTPAPRSPHRCSCATVTRASRWVRGPRSPAGSLALLHPPRLPQGSDSQHACFVEGFGGHLHRVLDASRVLLRAIPWMSDRTLGCSGNLRQQHGSLPRRHFCGVSSHEGVSQRRIRKDPDFDCHSFGPVLRMKAKCVYFAGTAIQSQHRKNADLWDVNRLQACQCDLHRWTCGFVTTPCGAWMNACSRSGRQSKG